jgi:hypothetical protein
VPFLRDRPDNGGKKAEREVPEIFILRWKGVRWTRDLGESVGGVKDEKSPKSRRVTLPRHRTYSPTSVSSRKLVPDKMFQLFVE